MRAQSQSSVIWRVGNQGLFVCGVLCVSKSRNGICVYVPYAYGYSLYIFRLMKSNTDVHVCIHYLCVPDNCTISWVRIPHLRSLGNVSPVPVVAV